MEKTTFLWSDSKNRGGSPLAPSFCCLCNIICIVVLSGNSYTYIVCNGIKDGFMSICILVYIRLEA